MSFFLLSELKTFPILPDKNYQLVNSEGLDVFYFEYKKKLTENGILKCNDNFDCNKFTQYFSAFAQIKYFKQSCP